VDVPQEYKNELDGLTIGGFATGLDVNLGAYAAQGIVLANFPGDLRNILLILEDEHNASSLIRSVLGQSKFFGTHCSMFGVWGSRTKDGRLFTGRNLDWVKDTGVSDFKLITVYHPEDGHAHATVGFAGLWGALTGMSAAGLTVHEANLESDDITFDGFPWVLRLRHVMAKANDLATAQDIFSNTNNTVGFNHMVGSSPDTNAVVFETMKSNTAVFQTMDDREATGMNESGEQTGFPLPEALYR
jgi:hypothetical protein